MGELFRLGQIGDMVYIHDREGDALLHLQVKDRHKARIDVTTEGVIEINKEYGPLAYMPIRVSLDYGRCEWVIERADQGNEWREVMRIPGQLKSDFPKVEEPPAPRDPTNPMKGWHPLGELLCWLGFHKHPKSSAPAWWTCEREGCDVVTRQRW
jgi:hypothetical protein